jgi:chaperonin GroEL
MYKKVEHGEGAKKRMMKGVDTVANAVKITLGASGNNVVLELHPSIPPDITKDGVSVANGIFLLDPVENAGAQLVKSVSRRASDEAGDGTTTAAVLAQAILREGFSKIKGANVTKVKKGMDYAVSEICKAVKESAVPINGDYKLLAKVATVSANGDEQIGNMVGSAMESIGQYGFLDFERSNSSLTETVITEGVELDKGVVVADMLLGNPSIEYMECYVAVINEQILTPVQAAAIMRPAFEAKKPLVIFCRQLGGAALNDIVANHSQGRIQCCAVEIGSMSEDFYDLAASFNCKVIGNMGAVTIDKVKLKDYGYVGKIKLTATKTTITGVVRNEEVVEELVNSILQKLAEEEVPSEKERLKQRIARLKGSIATIRVGGNGATETGEKYDRVEDAIKASRAALDGGVVEGGGVCLLRISEELPLEVFDRDEQLGINIVLSSIKTPFRQILANAGFKTSSFWKSNGATIDRIERETLHGNECYNVRTEMWENFLEKGIVDPAKVTCVALESAVSVASTILTTDAIITFDNTVNSKK